jgi:AAA15 family ATPase/GTPase
MIKWYKFKNFHSFKEETFVDLTLKANSAESSFDVDLDGTRVSKVLAILGPNGSGKSNLLKPLAFLKWFCHSSFKDLENKELLPFYPHSSALNEPSEIEMCFTDLTMSKGQNKLVEFKYYIKLKKNTILHEELKMKTSRLFTSIFSRKYDEEVKEYKVKSLASFNGDIGFPLSDLKTIPKNASAISYFNRKENLLATLVLENFSNIDNNLNVHGKWNFSYKNVLRATDQYFEDKELFANALKYLKRMDFGLDNILLKEEEIIEKGTGEKNIEILPYGVHSCDGESFEIPFYMESSGTQACFHIMSTLLSSFENGGAAVIDELDSDLHPHMITEIINMYENAELNKNNAQLIFSCHTPEVLKHLKKHHVYLVEKHDGKSECWRLDDVSGLRSQDNLYSKYITGALGGVPDICL